MIVLIILTLIARDGNVAQQSNFSLLIAQISFLLYLLGVSCQKASNK